MSRRPRHVCTVRDCGAEIDGWKRICDRHWRRLPHDKKVAITQASSERAFARLDELAIDAARWIAAHPPEAEAARRTGEAVE
jgi:hypothetical protein